jgi:hypothetical protein
MVSTKQERAQVLGGARSSDMSAIYYLPEIYRACSKLPFSLVFSQ